MSQQDTNRLHYLESVQLFILYMSEVQLFHIKSPVMFSACSTEVTHVKKMIEESHMHMFDAGHRKINVFSVSTSVYERRQKFAE